MCIYHDWESNSVSYVGGYLNFKLSNELLKSRGDLRTPKTTLHHHQDGHTIQEIFKDYHTRFTHRGGISALGLGKNKKGEIL